MREPPLSHQADLLTGTRSSALGLLHLTGGIIEARLSQWAKGGVVKRLARG